ncbi:MAG: hypothetical protein RLZZ165_2119 [Bacteroidota bacterium]|jgi:hypothetical protein
MAHIHTGGTPARTGTVHGRRTRTTPADGGLRQGTPPGGHRHSQSHALPAPPGAARSQKEAERGGPPQGGKKKPHRSGAKGEPVLAANPAAHGLIVIR